MDLSLSLPVDIYFILNYKCPILCSDELSSQKSFISFLSLRIGENLSMKHFVCLFNLTKWAGHRKLYHIVDMSFEEDLIDI